MNCSLTIFFSVLLDDLGDGVLFSLSPLSLTVFTMTGSSRLPSHSMKKVSALFSLTTLFCFGARSLAQLKLGMGGGWGITGLLMGPMKVPMAALFGLRLRCEWRLGLKFLAEGVIFSTVFISRG